MREHAVSRRRVLGIGAALGLMAATGLSTSAALARRPSLTGAELPSAVPLPPPFEVPLPIPAVLKPVSTAGGFDRYEITQREAVGTDSSLRCVTVTGRPRRDSIVGPGKVPS